MRKKIAILGVLTVVTFVLAVPAEAGVDYSITVTKGSGVGPGSWDIYYRVDVEASKSISKFGVGIDVSISQHFSNYPGVYYDDNPDGTSPESITGTSCAIVDDPAEEEPCSGPPETALGGTSPAPNDTCTGILEWTLPAGNGEGYYFFGYNIDLPESSYEWMDCGWSAEGGAYSGNELWCEPVGMGDGPVWTAVPEPATLSLLALGGLAVMRRRRK